MEDARSRCGVFSTQERLLKVCVTYIQKHCFFERLRDIRFDKNCITFSQLGMYVSIYGIDDVIINMIKTGLRKLIDQRGGDKHFRKLEEERFDRQSMDGMFKLEEGPFAEEKMIFKLQGITTLTTIRTHELCDVEYTITKHNDVCYTIK
jgi:hypothetical protein